MAQLLAELAAIKVPDRTKTFRHRGYQAPRQDGQTVTPCCVFFAPWFEIGQPDWNLEEGCTNEIVGFDDTVAEASSLYVTDQVHLKPDAPLGCVCRRCELASRALFNEDQERKRKEGAAAVIDADTDSDVEDTHALHAAGGASPHNAPGGGSKAPDTAGTGAGDEKPATTGGGDVFAGIVTSALADLPPKCAEVPCQTGRSLNSQAGIPLFVGNEKPPSIETPREIIASRFQEQIAALERRLKDRRRQLDYVRRVYYRDVFVVREHIFHKDNPDPWHPTFSTNLPSTVELSEFIRLFDPNSSLEVCCVCVCVCVLSRAVRLHAECVTWPGDSQEGDR